MVRKANIEDAESIYVLINKWAKKGLVLERSLNYIYENIRDYWVNECEGKIVGAVALHIIGWQHLGEIQSLVVAKNKQKRGVGRELVKSCIEEAKQLKIKRIFVLTFIPDFFKKFGFKLIKREKLPHKIWSDCINCIYFPNCKEEAMILKI